MFNTTQFLISSDHVYLVVVVGCAAGVQAGQKAFGLLLYSSRSGDRQEESGQL